MAGLWDRVAVRNDGVSAHLVKAAVYLVGRGVFTGTAARDAINSRIRTPLSAAAETDLNNILTQLNAQSPAVNKLDYLERMDALNIAAECGTLTNEATWRTQLGIT